MHFGNLFWQISFLLNNTLEHINQAYFMKVKNS